MKRLVFLPLALALGLCVATCSRYGDINRLPELLKPEWLQVGTDHRIAGDDRLVLVIGESHANVRGQLHLASVLERLLAEKQVDTVLVEGSEGPIEIGNRLDEIAGDLTPEAMAAYWQQQLNWGQISGWEYVTLIRPKTKAFGVEDMVAKLRFAIQSEGGTEAELKRDVESANRGAERLEKALSSLEQAGVSVPKARAALASHRQAIQALAAAGERYGEKRKPVLAKQIEVLENGAELEGLYKETGLAELQKKQASKEELEEWFQSLQRDKPQAAERLEELTKKREALESELKALDEAAEPSAKDLATQREVVRNSYFALANQLRHAAEAQWSGTSRPPTVVESLRQVETFFADERARARKDELVLTRPLLAERDRAMATNTAKYLKDSGARRAVLIVGAAHLEGIAENLQRLGLPYLSSRLLPQEGEEPWELEAWERRRKEVPALVSSGDLKEPTRLQEDGWWKEQAARIQIWGKAPAGQTYQIKGKDEGDVRVVYRGTLLPGERIRRAEHIVDYGPVPGHPAEVFEAWDRRLCKGLVDELSNDHVELAYAYFDLDSQRNRVYQTYTRQGARPLSTFLQSRPGTTTGSPSFVVLLSEPDVLTEEGSPRSPLWHAAREPLAGNGGNGRGQGPITLAGAAAEPDRRPGQGGNGSNSNGTGPRVATGGGNGGNGGGQGPTFVAGAAADPRRGSGKDGDGSNPTGKGPRVASGGDGGGRKGGNGHGGSGDGDRKGPSDGDYNDDRGNGEEHPPDWRWTAFFADPTRLEPTLVRTTDARRAKENVDVLLQQESLVPEEVVLLRGSQGLEDVKFTEANGANAGMVVLLASNVAEFRAAVKQAADSEKLTHKQVALITCGDLYKETAELREELLAAGVVMVWTLDRQITEQAGEQLMTQIDETLKLGIRPRNINDLVDRSIADLLQANPTNPDLKVLWESGAWVELQPVEWRTMPDVEEVG